MGHSAFVDGSFQPQVLESSSRPIPSRPPRSLLPFPSSPRSQLMPCQGYETELELQQPDVTYSFFASVDTAFNIVYCFAAVQRLALGLAGATSRILPPLLYITLQSRLQPLGNCHPGQGKTFPTTQDPLPGGRNVLCASCPVT